MSLLLVAAACGSAPGSGGDSPTTAVAGATTVPLVPPPTAVAQPLPTLIPPLPTAVPVTTVAPPPTTVPCRNQGTLYDPTGTRNDYDLRIGDCGLGVLELQGYLNNKLGHVIAEDGEFGPATDAAVRQFQLLVDLPVTGIVDLSTYIAVVNDDYDPADA